MNSVISCLSKLMYKWIKLMILIMWIIFYYEVFKYYMCV